ncbi:thiamine pyrophosphate-binding protein [Nonomuraea sp. NPDC005650]|uniref:thiamine pyrophosphate-binding protein n=1 Tax=Nonomuraea sp. NPDC005650 TaxID=3157045 RepID=UPI0033B9B6B1
MSGSFSWWRFIARVLAAAGCGMVTGLPSDEPGLLDAAAEAGELRAIPVRDQRVAACAAIGYAHVSGRPAVVALNSGPSFTNALTGLLEAASLGSPVVVVTTRIPAGRVGRGGFQYVDQRTMAGPVVKWSHTVERADQLVWTLRRAVHLAGTGRPGVTLVEIADEVLREPSAWAEPPVMRGLPELRAVAQRPDVERAAVLLREAALPVLLAGGGARRAGAGSLVTRLAELLAAPMLTTASGRGTVDERHRLACGLAGLYAGPGVQGLLAEADMVVSIGSRLEETATTGWSVPPRLIQLDCDPAAYLESLEPEAFLLGDAALTLAALVEALSAGRPPDRRPREARIAQVKSELDALAVRHEDRLATPSVIRAAVAAAGDDAIIVQENGLHDMWGYHYPILTAGANHTIVAPGEQTMVGFGLGAALGAAEAAPDRPVLLICGDGAAEMSAAALPTIAERRRGITVVMLDNRGFGWPRLLRGGSAAGITVFPAGTHVPQMVDGLGGVSFAPATMGELKAALDASRQANKAGRLALITVQVPDEPLPPAALTATGGHHA